MAVKIVDALILVTAFPGMHKDLVAALAMQEDDTYATYKIRGISQVYEALCHNHDHDAVVAVTAKDSEITNIETAIKTLSTKRKGLLVKRTHVIPHVIKVRGDP